MVRKDAGMNRPALSILAVLWIAVALIAAIDVDSVIEFIAVGVVLVASIGLLVAQWGQER